MTNAQWTVIGLLVFLLGLEVLRVPQIRTFFSSFYSSFNMQASGTNKK